MRYQDIDWRELEQDVWHKVTGNCLHCLNVEGEEKLAKINPQATYYDVTPSWNMEHLTILLEQHRKNTNTPFELSIFMKANGEVVLVDIDDLSTEIVADTVPHAILRGLAMVLGIQEEAW